MTGQTISHYRITEKLGEGGMGVVYKAEDTKLDRPVALKFLPPHLLGNEEVRKRFEREAKAAAALHHPNICPVYEIDEVDGKAFIAMAYIEGKSLDKKIVQGPLKLDDALDIAQQIGKGLQAAHKKGIFHRDIKPENMIVNDDRHVTIMDFGLAQLTEASRLTRDDTTLGTAAYMSPEQTEGSGTDHRTDIWSLGVVLYEMLTGQRPFKGDYDKAIMYSILNEQPEPITALRTGVPMELEFIVGKCLNKDPAKRCQSASDLILDLQGAGRNLVSGKPGVTAPHTAVDRPADVEAQRSRALLVAIAACVLLLGLNLFQWFGGSGGESPKPVVRFSFQGEPGAPIDVRSRVAISPDGRHIAYIAAESPPRIWVRDLAREEARPIIGTERASLGSIFAPSRISWSSDGKALAYGAGEASDEFRITTLDGESKVLCQSCSTVGSSWSPDGTSIAVAITGFLGGPDYPILYSLPTIGGPAVQLVEPQPSDKGPGYVDPFYLPGLSTRRALLFTIGSPLDHDVHTMNLDRREKWLLTEGYGPVYSPSGHVVYETGPGRPGVWALPFSAETLSATGDPFPVNTGGTAPSVSLDGTLAYADFIPSPPWQLVWLDRNGKRGSTIGRRQRRLMFPSLSPDGLWVAVEGGTEGETSDIWLHSTTRPVSRRLTTQQGREGYPAWTSNGDQLSYFSTASGSGDIVISPGEGGGDARIVAGSREQERAHHWSLDGKHVIYRRSGAGTQADIWSGSRGADGTFEHKPFRAAPADEQAPQFSPNGRFVAYCSDETGAVEVWAAEFPQGRSRQISETGGCQPRWSLDGKELYYVNGRQLFAVSVGPAAEFTFGESRPLFTHAGLQTETGAPSYDVSPDGRFVVVEEQVPEELPNPRIHVVQNWYEEFRDREQD